MFGNPPASRLATIALLALSTGQPMLLDAAVVLSLVSFLGTTAFILLFRRRGREADPAAGPQGHAPGGGEAAGTEREPCANGEAAR